ncbi:MULTISPECIES: glycosyltransferase family 4 protein [unclassified Pseudomonas]|uniref:glycosyltransferase family 4 protein n=1 Tax=unclassified Pseudomonas TaxID=196821 RepID=UPI0011EFD057|nr:MULTISPECIES: glycosyltransferase family 4 protein [unclassified Pseudomonas]KAA0948225.1 glycosyltransferase family 4 protein [Pseudomonas sp. ANT_H4]KAA0953024.1 glycosyltransferase family 4 protein [Pseudomonas sp. ANT_H14]
MRVLLLVQELSIGGLPNYALDLARALIACGDQVVLAHQGVSVPAHLDSQGVEIISLAGAGSAFAAVEQLRAWSPDVIHVHLCSDVALLEALVSSGLALVRSFHDYTSMCLRRGRRRFAGDRCARALGWSCALYGCVIGPPSAGGRVPRLMDLPGKLHERTLYQGFDAAVVGSQHMRRVLLSNGFAAERLSVVPYFSRFDHVAQGEPAYGKAPGLATGDRPVRLLFTGQAVKGKGLEVLIRALARVHGNWRLTAITSGPRLLPAKVLADRHGLSERIEFIEWLTPQKLAAYYRDADLFVLPSVWDDPGPLVGIEAMSFETPVLAFPVGGIPDYVQDGETGLLAAQVSARALATGLQRALDNPSDLTRLGRAARVHVVRAHSRDGHIDTLRRLYLSCSKRVAAQSEQLITLQELG